MNKRLCTRLQIRIAGAVILMAFFSHTYSRAQFLGFTSPQTITQAAKFTASGTGGTSTTQSCATVGTGVFFNVTNIGQAIHALLYQTSGAITSLGVEIQGSKDGSTGSFLRISETANSITAGGVYASIYLPIVRIAITSCTGTGTITATYTGSNVPTTPTGIFTSSGTYNKDVAIGLPANATATFTVPLPNGGTGGAVYFKFSAATCAGSTLTVTAGPDATHQVTLLNAVALANVATTQAFTVPAIPATIAVVTYTTGCVASGATYDLSFSVGERIVTADVTAVFNGGGNSPPAQVGFSCERSAPFSFVAGAGAWVQVATSGGVSTRIHICHISFSATAASSFQIISGTGVACGVGTSQLTGTYPNVSTFSMDWGWWGSLNSPAGDNVCIAVGAATTVGGVIIYASF